MKNIFLQYLEFLNLDTPFKGQQTVYIIFYHYGVL